MVTIVDARSCVVMANSPATRVTEIACSATNSSSSHFDVSIFYVFDSDDCIIFKQVCEIFPLDFGLSTM